MLRVLSLTVAVAAFAVSANAAEVKVNLAGTTPAQAHALIAGAAMKACDEAYIGDSLGYYLAPACAKTAEGEAWAKIGSPTALNQTVSTIRIAVR